jgi:Flp pilus assembly protein TadG
MMRRAFAEIRAALKNFRKSERGNVAMMFGVVAIPLVVAAGAVVDFSRIYYAHTDLQDSLDAAALMLSKTAPTMAPGQLQKAAQDYFYANYRDGDVQNLTVNPTYDPGGPSLTIAGTASVHMYFMGLAGFNDVPIQASSQVVWGETRLRVALVLDNTGSMAQAGKMGALKAASHTLLSQMQTAAKKNGDVYVSIVPFSRDVTIDTVNVNATWVDWDLFGKCSVATYKDKKACTDAGKTWTATSPANWKGCITDRDQPYDTQNTAPSVGTEPTLFPADNYAACPTLMMALSYDWPALNARVDLMQPNGLTNQSIGLQWGWQSLTAAPFVIPPKDPGVDYREVVILLSDGLNTQDRWYSNAKQIDARQKILCQNVKDAGFDIFTVQVNTDNDPTSTLLQDCASDPSQFFLLTSADQIVATFQQIGTRLSQLRVSS